MFAKHNWSLGDDTELQRRQCKRAMVKSHSNCRGNITSYEPVEKNDDNPCLISIKKYTEILSLSLSGLVLCDSFTFRNTFSFTENRDCDHLLLHINLAQ